MAQTVLVVDDDKMNLLMAQNILKSKFKVSAVNSGEMAYKALESMIPDLILLDINMPGVSGFDVIRKLKTDVRYENIPIVFLTAEQDATLEAECFTEGAEDFVKKPFVPEVLISRVERILALREYQNNLESMVETQSAELLKQSAELNRIQQEVIGAMADLIESRDDSTGNHVKRTTQYVGSIITFLKEKNIYSEILTAKYVRNLLNAAPMHDIGKIKIPDRILQKPGRLTDEEFDIMKTHSLEGAKIIDEVLANIETPEYIQVARDVALSHHEKWNGQGYPNGISGENIPLAARIMALADVFDALVSKRCYKDAMTYEQAFSIIEESSGSHFDPEIAKVVLDNKERFIHSID